MKYAFKKILSLTLAVLLVFSVLAVPMTAGALETDAPSEEGSAPVFCDAATNDEEAPSSDPVLGGESEREAPRYECVEGEAIVVFKNGMDVSAVESVADISETLTVGEGEKQINAAVVSAEKLSSDQLMNKLGRVKGVKYVLPNTIKRVTSVTNDPYSGYQWALSNTGQDNGIVDVDTNPENLWEVSASTGKESVVAVLDTGIDKTHPDLKNILWKNTYPSLPGYGDCGYDFTGTVKSGSPIDGNGHGTHCAGIIAAAGDNKIGISGINKSGVKLMALKIGDDDGNISSAAEIKAYNYVIRAKELGVNIKSINCSFGGYGTADSKAFYDDLFDTLGSYGIVTCVAAGNENENIDKMNYVEGEYYYTLPAASESKYCVTVGAATESGERAYFSCYGTKNVDIFAPGTAILSTVCYNALQPSLYDDAKRSKLLSCYQSYNGSVKSSDFGSIGSIDTTPLSNSGYNFKNIKSLSYSSEFFGQSGKSLKIELSDKLPYEGRNTYMLSIPYKLSSSTGKYSFSLAARADGDCVMALMDVPKSYRFEKDVPYVMASAAEEWNVNTVSYDPSSTSGYLKGTDRKMIVIIQTLQKDVTLYFDDIAVSRQNLDESQFEKYDYYPGTSMATPYVAGAVALISNCYPNLSAMSVIGTLKKSARNIPALNQYAAGGRFLDLKNAESSVSTADIPVESISLDRASASVSVGETLRLRATVTPDDATNPTVTWSSSNISVATVSSVGTVTGVKAGSATITAKTSNGKTASCKITVKALTQEQQNIRKIKNYINNHYNEIDEDGKNVVVNFTNSSTGYTGKVYLYLNDYDELGFYYIETISDDITVHGYFDYDFSVSYDITPYMFCFIDGDEALDTYADINAGTYDPQSGPDIVYGSYDSYWMTEDEAISLSESILNRMLDVYDFFLNQLVGIRLGDIGFANYQKTLPAPKVTSLENTTTGVKITWGKVSGAAQYRVFLKNATGWTGLGNTKSTSYTYTDVKSGSSYTFTVRCLSSDGKSYTSSYNASGWTQKFVASPKITKMENTASGIKLSLGKVTGGEKYRIYLKTTSGWHKLADTISTSYTYTGAKSGSSYTFTVRCITSDAKSFLSSFYSSGWTQKFVASPKITKTENTMSGIKLSWGKVAGAEKYRVFVKSASGWKKAGDTASTSYIYTGVKSGTTYTFTVRCLSADSKSFTSSYSSAGWSRKFISAPKISALSNTSKGVKITWGKVAGAAKYRVYVKTSNGWQKIGDTTSNTLTHTAAKSGTTYTYTVRCISADAKSFTSAFDSKGKSIKAKR